MKMLLVHTARLRLGRKVGGIYRGDVDERILATLPEFFFLHVHAIDRPTPHPDLVQWVFCGAATVAPVA